MTTTTTRQRAATFSVWVLHPPGQPPAPAGTTPAPTSPATDLTGIPAPFRRKAAEIIDAVGYARCEGCLAPIGWSTLGWDATSSRYDGIKWRQAVLIAGPNEVGASCTACWPWR